MCNKKTLAAVVRSCVHFFFFSSRRRHTRFDCDWSSDVCSSDLFLGFTHICVKKRSNGMYTVLRQTIRKRLQTKLNEVKAELRRRMHEPIPKQGKWLQAVVRGHLRYYGVPMNNPALALFRFQVRSEEHTSLSRRSQNGRVLWDRMRRLIARWLPLPTVCHPYPLRRMRSEEHTSELQSQSNLVCRLL